MPKFIDLTGRKFGRLTVLGRAPNRSNHTAWNCRCDCGNEKEIAGSSLKSGITVSCGCYNREISSNRNKTNFSHTNEYEFTVDTCIGYTSKGEMFLVDIDKYDLIKDFSWYISSDGYVLSNDNSGDKQKHIFLHRLITGCPVGMVVDHINGAERRFDNRLCNLRICTSQENQFNRRADKRNTLGVKGVSKTTHGNKYQAQIQIDGKLKYLGSYETLKEAADAYDKKAVELFGEFAWLNNYTDSLW